MSRENAVKFLETIDREPTFFQKVMDGAATAGAWLSAGATHGFEVTLDELRSVTEELLGKPIDPSQLIGELRSFFEGELSDANLAQVAGGTIANVAAVRSFSISNLSRIISLAHLTSDPFISDSGPSWVNYPHSFGNGLIVFPV
jgi:predicted ribosomally synthesized peptide with nif11-like leader